MNCACGERCYNNNNRSRKGKDRQTQLLSLLPSLPLVPLAYFEHRQNGTVVIIDLCIALIQLALKQACCWVVTCFPGWLKPASSSEPSILHISEMSIYLPLHPQSLSLVSLAGVLFRLLSFLITHRGPFLLLCPFLCFPLSWYVPQASSLSISQKCSVLFVWSSSLS